VAICSQHREQTHGLLKVKLMGFKVRGNLQRGHSWDLCVVVSKQLPLPVSLIFYPRPPFSLRAATAEPTEPKVSSTNENRTQRNKGKREDSHFPAGPSGSGTGGPPTWESLALSHDMDRGQLMNCDSTTPRNTATFTFDCGWFPSSVSHHRCAGKARRDRWFISCGRICLVRLWSTVGSIGVILQLMIAGQGKYGRY
jgi:hypothetical protein